MYVYAKYIPSTPTARQGHAAPTHQTILEALRVKVSSSANGKNALCNLDRCPHQAGNFLPLSAGTCVVPALTPSVDVVLMGPIQPAQEVPRLPFFVPRWSGILAGPERNAPT